MELLQNCPICNSTQFNTSISGKDYFLSGETFSIVRCESCGFRFTNPRPDAEELSQYYQSSDYISHSDARKGIFNNIYQWIRKYTLSKKHNLIATHSTKGKLLDIGCATGHFLYLMKKKGWETYGIEPDKKTRDSAIEAYKLNVFTEEELDTFEKEFFDVITMWHVLEHVSQLNKRIAQLKRLLKKDGVIFIAVPNCSSYDAEKYGVFWAGYDLPRHLYHFTAEDMKRVLKNFGLIVEEVMPMKFDSFYVSLLSEKYKTGKMRWIPGMWTGLLSNLKANENNGTSSLIFVVKNQKSQN